MAEDRHRLGHAAPGLGQILRRVLAEPVNGEVVDPARLGSRWQLRGTRRLNYARLGIGPFSRHTAYVPLPDVPLPEQFPKLLALTSRPAHTYCVS
jgi:hypothetical protein